MAPIRPYDAAQTGDVRLATSVGNAAELLRVQLQMVRLPVYLRNGRRLFAQIIPFTDYDGRHFVMGLVVCDRRGHVVESVGAEASGRLDTPRLTAELRECLRMLGAHLRPRTTSASRAKRRTLKSMR